MIRLAVPLAGASAFFLVSLITVRLLRPADPKRFFLGYGSALLAVAAYVYVQLWPLETIDAAAGLTACLLLQALICLTMWNAFYSLLWGFSGGLMHDLYNHAALRDIDRLVRSYQGTGGFDRILARRLPNLAAGGFIELQGQTLRLPWKGRVIAWGTLAAFKAFSLGMGGGVK
ncbi:MAG: hypothetical protein ABI868_21365 [Acidobacteriota bacterium]